ncbi:MAG: HD domain-containing protein [Candidatus Coatesbacteria bacterium]|nr:HD domain-containing protein [Candidatus Coatesbacteria bacterium]
MDTPATVPISDIPDTKSDFVGLYLLKSKTLCESKGGASYLRLRLSDRTGEIDAFVWQDVDIVAAQIESGQVVKLKGHVNIFQQKANVKVLKIRTALGSEYDTDMILEGPSIDQEKLWGMVQEMIERVEDVHYRALLDLIFSDNAFLARFKSAPGAKAIHHAYRGGLLEHTVSLLRLASGIIEVYPDLDADLLITSAILHDMGKMQEYNEELLIERTTEGRLLGHIVIGLLSLQRYMDDLEGFPQNKRRKLLHILISHHGSLEWGSPQVPMTLEAITLHYIDNLDAKLAQFRAASEKRKDPNFEGFTMFDKFLERYVYFGDRPEIAEQERDS